MSWSHFQGSKWSARMPRRMLSVWTFFLDSSTLWRWEHPRTMDTKQRGNAENHTITMSRCATRLFRLFCYVQSEFLSFRRFASSRFNFLSPDRFPVLVSTVLRVQLGVTKFLRNFGWDPCLTSAIQSDCWWLTANKSCRLVINTATVRNAV
jgi:hypothetical protein